LPAQNELGRHDVTLFDPEGRPSDPQAAESNPAPVSRITDAAICAATNPPRNQPVRANCHPAAPQRRGQPEQQSDPADATTAKASTAEIERGLIQAGSRPAPWAEGSEQGVGQSAACRPSCNAQ